MKRKDIKIYKLIKNKSTSMLIEVGLFAKKVDYETTGARLKKGEKPFYCTNQWRY